MADHCCAPPPLNLGPRQDVSAFRCVLWAVLGINAAMFLVEIGAGLASGSAALFGTGTGWPDIVVAAIMAVLALQGSVTVVRHALAELKPPAAATA